MELRYVDPRSLIPNPENTRNIKPDPAYDAQLAANIREIGLIQPPVVREINGKLVVKAGDRRRVACITVGHETIPVLVVDNERKLDKMVSLSENLIRHGVGTVDLWRAIEGMLGDGWTEDGVAVALSLPVKTVKRLRLCGNIHPAILDQMGKGDEPNEQQLRIIASTPREDQAEAWKKHKPKKGERVTWWEFSRALDRRRMYARDADFDAALGQAYGIVWEEDLFEQADGDTRYTTQVEEYLGAQHEWMSNHLPKKGVILTVGSDGQVKLPPKAERHYGEPRKGDIVGTYVDERTGKIAKVAYRMPAAKDASKKGKSKTGNAPEIEAADDAPPAKMRAPVTKDGMKMIGDFRTDALHKALADDEIDDLTMIGLLILAICGKNVEVRSPLPNAGYHQSSGGRRDSIAASIVPEGLLTGDPATLRQTAREALRFCLGLRESNYGGNSGIVARIAGIATGADRHLPAMATEEFLSCLSKPEIEAIASANGVLPKPTGKATRAALIERFKDEHFVYPGAKFALGAAETATLAERAKDAEDEEPLEGDLEPGNGEPNFGAAAENFGEDAEAA
jgi:ParB family chromosome partitioning protein